MKKYLAAALSTITIAGFLTIPFAYANPNPNLIEQNTGLSPTVVNLALKGYQYAEKHGDVHNKNYLTIVDFSLPSTAKRLWVINLKNNKVVYNELVGQGHDGGYLYARYFSNQPGSHESSLGVYTTGVSYYGNDGYSMHLHGLEAGINNNAYNREIEVHGAWYISPSFIKQYGHPGRTWGCFGMNKKVVSTVINTIKGGSVFFAYAKQENHDPYLT